MRARVNQSVSSERTLSCCLWVCWLVEVSHSAVAVNGTPRSWAAGTLESGVAKRRMRSGRRFDAALRTTLAATAVSAVCLLPSQSSQLVFPFMGPVITMLVAPSNIVGTILTTSIAFLQTTLLMTPIATALYAMLCRIDLLAYKIAMPFVVSALSFLILLTPWVPPGPSKNIAVLFIVLVLIFPLHSESLRQPPMDLIAIELLAVHCLGCSFAVLAVVLPLPRLDRWRVLPASAALQATDALRLAQAQAASLMCAVFETARTSEEAHRAAVHHLWLCEQKTLDELSALLPAARTELWLLGRAGMHGELAAWHALLTKQRPLMQALVRIYTEQSLASPFVHPNERDQQHYLRELAPTMAALARAVSEAIVLEARSESCSSGLAAHIRALSAAALDADCRARYEIYFRDSAADPSPGSAASGVRSTNFRHRHSLRRTAAFEQFLAVADEVATFLEEAPARAPSALQVLGALVPLVGQLRRPWPPMSPQALRQPFKVALAMAITCLWVSSDTLSNSTAGNGAWVPLTCGLVFQSSAGESFAR